MTQHLPLVGIDVGGTFTDFVVLNQDQLNVYKLPTTPDDQSRAIRDGLQNLGLTQADITHGMTVATNALLERRGACTALLTTEGFADVLLIGRQNRPQVYQLTQTRPAPLVEETLRLEVPERLDKNGQVLRPLDEVALQAVADRLTERAVESLAIVFLFAFQNPDHERRAADLIQSRLPDLPLSLSSEILPEYREYERTATTVINAYVQPLVARYLTRLEQTLTGSQVRIMQSNGGAIGLEQAASQAARLVLSGPAGGVVGAFDLAKQALQSDQPQLMTFDMGGTSTDVALCPGLIPTTAESTITDLPLRLPMIDIHTVGAGGGSIAYLDLGSGLRVGPRSAGASPGPVCYGQGGAEPTVTDANLVLGRLDPSGFLGGEEQENEVSLSLDEAAARQALRKLGDAIGLSSEAAALGVIQIANATMERALRRVSIELGYDPRQFTLMPFGGAGPLHACDLAESLNIQQILIPPMPGVLSAYGMLVADIVNDASQSILTTAQTLLSDLSPLQNAFTALAERVQSIFAAEGVTDPRLTAALDVRYQGQSYELTVPLRLSISPENLAQAITDFHQSHQQHYGYAMPEEEAEIVTLRVRGSRSGARPALPVTELGPPDPSPAFLKKKPVWFSHDGALETSCYQRRLLRPGNQLLGPAIIFQFDTTLVVAPKWQARVDGFSNIWLTYLS